MELVDVEEWCGACCDLVADKVLVSDGGKIIGWYCDLCGEQQLANLKKLGEPRARCMFQRNSNQQCTLDDKHTGNHNLPCIESSAHGPHAGWGGYAADGTVYQCPGQRFDRT